MNHSFEIKRNAVLISLYVIFSIVTVFVLNSIIQNFSKTIIENNHQKHVYLIQMQYQELLMRNIPPEDIYMHIGLLSNTLDVDSYITDNLGRIIYTSTDDKDIVGSTLPITIVSDALLNRRTTVNCPLEPLFSDTRIISSSPVLNNHTISGAIINISKLDNLGIYNEVHIYFVLCIVAFIIALHVIHKKLLFSRTSALISDLNDAIKRIAKGDFSPHIETNAKGPVGDLAKNMLDMIEKLEEYEGNRTDYISNISHDFRTPLTSIKGFVEAMQDGTIPPDSYDYYLDIIHEEAERLTTLTTELLVLNTIQSSNHKLDLVKFNIQTVIQKALIQFEQKIEEKSINIQINLSDEAKGVYADLNQIHRILHNILDNAIKFTPSKGTISVETTLYDDKVYICISDTGEGIPHEDIPYIFSRFYKGDKSRGKSKSSGIGLAVVKEIIDAHHQEIIVDSEVNNGTSFTFTLTHHPS